MAVLSPGTASAVSTGGVPLNYPFQAALDGAGNIYVANYNGNNVVKISVGGGSASVVSTGGLTLNEAAGVAVDGAGTLYIADYGHNRIVRVAATGAASVLTVTGLATAINQPAALAMDGAGNLYIADWGNNRIVEVTPAGAGYVLATGAITLSSTGVTGVAADASGNVYIADRSANHIVKVAASGAASLVTVTGLTLTNPQGVAVDGMGNLYIADSGHRRIVRLIAGTASVVQTPGVTLGAIMYGVTADSNGNIYAVDWSNNRVVKVSVASASLSFANTGIGAISSDSPKIATVTNIGNQALVAAANPNYTADFSEDSSDANLCTASTSLEPGEFCDVAVQFTPQSAGVLSANVVITDNHLNATSVTHNVAVRGTGTPGSASIELQSSRNPALIASSVTLTAIVYSPVSTPTGSVSFYDGTTLMGSVALVSGAATYTTSSLAAAAHSLTAVYGGDSNFSSVTSAALSQVVSDVNLNLVSGASSSATVSAGGTATYHLTIAPSSGSVLPAAVSLTASGAPAGSTVAITPASIPAGAGATSVTLAIRVPATSAGMSRSQAWAYGFALPLMGLLVLPFEMECRWLSRKRLLSAGLLFVAAVLTGALLACGAARVNTPPPAPQAKNYSIRITATSGTISHVTTLTLTVQ